MENNVQVYAALPVVKYTYDIDIHVDNGRKYVVTVRDADSKEQAIATARRVVEEKEKEFAASKKEGVNPLFFLIFFRGLEPLAKIYDICYTCACKREPFA